jgi:hypothetical protein
MLGSLFTGNSMISLSLRSKLGNQGMNTSNNPTGTKTQEEMDREYAQRVQEMFNVRI